MARPFISYTKHRRDRMLWLRDLLKSLGFDDPIVVSGMDPRPPLQKVREELAKADCLFAIISPERPESGSPTESSRPAPWIQDELAIATDRNLPIGAVCEPGIRLAGTSPTSFTWETVDLDDLQALLQTLPSIIAGALRIKRFIDQAPDQDFPFTYKQVRMRDQLQPGVWHQLRMITITARQQITESSHAVDAGIDKTPGISVKLSDPSSDLKITSKERPNIRTLIIRNEDHEVAYKVFFEPPLLPGEEVSYRHESRHVNIFPMTSAEIRSRSVLPGSPPFMADGFVGDAFDIRRPIEELILELETPLETKFTAPEVRVYITDMTDQVEGETRRIGNPNTAKHLWQVVEDPILENWTCRVKIPNPVFGLTYCLIARPTS